MRAATYLLMGILLVAATAKAQDKRVFPFSRLEQQVKLQQGGWNGSKEVLSEIFNQERKRLGDQFETELVKYIGSDAERHYWIASFLIEPEYLHGSKALPQLSMRIMEQGIDLLKGKTDDDSVGTTLSFHVMAAVLAHKLGLASRAASHKDEAERRLSINRDWSAFFPAMSEDDSKIYDSIPTTIKVVRSSLPTDDGADRPKTRVIAGVLNTRATVFPKPSYPPHIDASGDVIVSIVYDEFGKVIWARAVSGPLLLHESAVAAALKATFPPFTLEGKPEKVSGVLIYKFVR